MDLTPEVKVLYKTLRNSLQGFGKIGVEEKKTSIHLINRAAFAGVHPRKDYFILNIVSDQPIASQRIEKTEQVSKSRFHNELRIASETDINPELIGWLKAAYELMK
jgi:hypothetical protein